MMVSSVVVPNFFCAVKIQVKARKVTVTGPRGAITKDLSHMNMDIRVMKLATPKMKGLYVRLQMWHGKYKHTCAVTTFKSHINNMIIGVTEVSFDKACRESVWCVRQLNLFK
jgi:ribosomal protein L6P/L9E